MEKASTKSVSILRQKDMKPEIRLPGAHEPAYYRPMFRYVGTTEKYPVNSKTLEFHTTYLPVGASSTALHWTKGADAVMMPITGKALFWDALGNQEILEPYDAIFLKEHPYNFRNVGTEDIWFLHPTGPADILSSIPAIYYDKGPPPSKEEMFTKGMAGVMKAIRFKELKPEALSPECDKPAHYRPLFRYVGSDEACAVKSEVIDFSLMYLPPTASTPSFHYKPKADMLIVPITGKVLFWDQKGNEFELDPLDGIFLREHPCSYRNVSREGAWLAFSYAPSTAPTDVYE